MPVQPEPKESIQPLRQSIRLEDRPPGKYFMRPPTTVNISRDALYHVLGNAMFDTSAHSNIPDSLMKVNLNMSPVIILETMKEDNLAPDVNLKELCNGVVHPVTNKTITKYQKLIEDPLFWDEWEAMCKELGRLAQRYGEMPGTNTIGFPTHEEI